MTPSILLFKQNKTRQCSASTHHSKLNTHHTKSGHTLFRMFLIGKFNQVHWCLSSWDQNVSEMNVIYRISLWGACWTQCVCAALIWSLLPVMKYWLLIQLRGGPGGTNHDGPMVFSSSLPSARGADAEDIVFWTTMTTLIYFTVKLQIEGCWYSHHCL